MGAFSIYLWAGLFELKDYPVLNKILAISLITYNIIFIAGLVSFYIGDPIFLNTTFAFSFWIILGLGFILFGRKYIVVWRFMSPNYLTLFLYVIAWLAVVFINQYTPIEFNQNTPLDISQLSLSSLFLNIYVVLIAVNWLIYCISGPILDKLLGIKRIKANQEILNLVDDVKKDIGIKGRVKVGFGKYPILNAMAYGPVFDKRIAIIAEDIDQIPRDELRGIVAHELAHTKGKHTLILTIITALDLFIRMIFGLPATYYDYTFGDPNIPMVAFIFLNLGIYAILYIFVRILEGKADLMSKKAGYAEELSKALYNLEGFYATGREIGLNTMLLADEKITRENQIFDYLDTAIYINKAMIAPSRASLLSNLLNSHPPSYHRVAAILGDNSSLKPLKESLLPFICLKKSKQKLYAKKFENARQAFKQIATDKFKEKFGVQNIPEFLEGLDRKQLYRLEMGHQFIFIHKISDAIIIGKLKDVEFSEDITDPDLLIVESKDDGNIVKLKANEYARKEISLNHTYYLQKEEPLKLRDIDLSSKQDEAYYVFEDGGKEIQKNIKKTRLPYSLEYFNNLIGKDVFLKLKGTIKIYKCLTITPNNDLNELELQFTNQKESLKYKLKDLIIRPKNVSFTISKNPKFKKHEVALLEWLKEEKIRTFVYFKKPVNYLEVGYLKRIKINTKGHKSTDPSSEDNNDEYILIQTIFGMEKKIAYKILEAIAFEVDSILIQKKAETSSFSKLGYKITSKLKPKKVIY